MKLITIILTYFGFESIRDFGNSVFYVNKFLFLTLLSIPLGTIASLCENYVGLTPLAYIVFASSFILDFMLGTIVAYKKGTFKSFKVLRTGGKLVVYTIILSIIYILSKEVQPFNISVIEFNHLSLIHLILLHFIILAQLTSISEKMVALGFNEFSIITKSIGNLKRKLTKKVNDTTK